MRKYLALWSDGHTSGTFEYASTHRLNSKGNLADARNELHAKYGLKSQAREIINTQLIKVKKPIQLLNPRTNQTIRVIPKSKRDKSSKPYGNYNHLPRYSCAYYEIIDTNGNCYYAIRQGNVNTLKNAHKNTPDYDLYHDLIKKRGYILMEQPITPNTKGLPHG